MQRVLDAYFDGINGERYGEVGALFAPAGELVAPGTEPRRGPQSIAAYFAAALAPYPVHHDEPTRVILAERTATVEITFTGRLADGTPLGFEAVDVFDFDADARILRLTSWYDSHAVRARLAEARGRPVRPLLVARVDHRPGQEETFNAWYPRHLDEVLAVPGVRSVQRYRTAAGPPAEWLALYELTEDPASVVAELRRRRAAGEWSPREGIDESAIEMHAYAPVSASGAPLPRS